MSTPTNGAGRLTLRVLSRTVPADGIASFELGDVTGAPLPPFTAGSHIDVDLPDGMRRSYSLCGAPAAHETYVIAVHRSPSSRGGSAWVHDHLSPGDQVVATPPLNDFPLDRGSAPAVLIAGGIGITPIVSMAHDLGAAGRPWTLHYAARTRGHAAFVDELRQLAARTGGQVELHLDDELGGVLDVAAIVRGADDDAQLYCCGPTPMLDAFMIAAESYGDRAHIERFTGEALDDGVPSDVFEVYLARSELTFTIAADTTILETLKKAPQGLDVNYSCEEGICGTCELGVISGTPLHRDSVLSEAEREAGRTMMICVSRSAGGPLTLDF